MASVTRRPLMAGNWKMNLNHLEAIALVQKLAFTPQREGARPGRGGGAAAVHRPPQRADAGRRRQAAHRLRRAGPLRRTTRGAYTGEISGAMLAKLGCTYVVVGHSERRQYHDEDDDAGQRQGARRRCRHELTPILCVGEGLESARRASTSRTLLAPARRRRCARSPPSRSQVDRDRVRAGLGDRHRQDRHAGGRPGGLRRDPRRGSPSCTTPRWPPQVRILYGGSVKADNIAAIMAQPDVDGALVGGASLDAEEFVKICRFGEMSG